MYRIDPTNRRALVHRPGQAGMDVEPQSRRFTSTGSITVQLRSNKLTAAAVCGCEIRSPQVLRKRWLLSNQTVLYGKPPAMLTMDSLSSFHHQMFSFIAFP